MGAPAIAFLGVTLFLSPFLLLWSLPGPAALVLGTLVSLLLLLRSLLKKETDLLTVMTALYFLLSSVLYFHQGLVAVLEMKAVSSFTLLAFVGYLSAGMGRPYTLQGAGRGYNREFRDSPLFIEVNKLITRIWATIYLANALILYVLEEGFLPWILGGFLILSGIIASWLIPALLPATGEDTQE